MDKRRLEKDLQRQIDAGTLDLAGVERLLGVAGYYVDTDATPVSTVYKPLPMLEFIPTTESVIVRKRTYYEHCDQYRFQMSSGPIYLVFPPYLSYQFDSEIVWHPEFQPARKPEIFERLTAVLSPKMFQRFLEDVTKREICLTGYVYCTSLYFLNERKFRSAMCDNGFGHHTDRILQRVAEILKMDLS